MRLLFLIFTLCSSLFSVAQEINNYSTLFDVRDSSFTRISYDNDLFVGTDQYYTQGIGIDVFSYKLRKNPLNRVLFRLKNSDRDRFGIQFRTHGCTPTSILSDSVLIGDRPYAGVFTFGIVRTSQQTDKHQRLTSSLDIGMIGPAALGKEIQTEIHKITGNDLPLGWQHQIKNSPIVNYLIRMDFELLTQQSWFDASCFYELKLGTFQTNLSTGMNLSIGRKNNAFSPTENHRFEYYAYYQGYVTAVGYDASLMGGILNRDGYYLRYSEINPLVMRMHFGLVFAAPHFSIATDLGFASKEIRAGTEHLWGGLRLTFY